MFSKTQVAEALDTEYSEDQAQAGFEQLLSVGENLTERNEAGAERALGFGELQGRSGNGAD